MKGITNAQKAGGGSLPVTTYFTNNTGTTLDTQLILGNNIMIFKNGCLLEGGSGNDYTISGSVITFTTALEATDKIAIAH